MYVVCMLIVYELEGFRHPILKQSPLNHYCVSCMSWNNSFHFHLMKEGGRSNISRVRSRIDGRGERNIPCKDVETSPPNRRVLKL